MKKRFETKIGLQKTIISKFLTDTKANEILGGGTSPKCAYSEWDTCEANR